MDLQGHASDGEALVCWGTVRMTMTGDRSGPRQDVAATGGSDPGRRAADRLAALLEG